MHPSITFPDSILRKRAAISDAKFDRHHVGERVSDRLVRCPADDADEVGFLRPFADLLDRPTVEDPPAFRARIERCLDKGLLADMPLSFGFRNAANVFCAGSLVELARVQEDLVAAIHHHDRKFPHLLGEGTRAVLKRRLSVREGDEMEAHRPAMPQPQRLSDFSMGFLRSRLSRRGHAR